MSKNDSTKFTPFQLFGVFGRAPVLPIEMEIQSNSADSCADQVEGAPPDFEKKVCIMMGIRNQVKVQATLNIDKAQDRQKKAYNTKHQPLHFEEGDAVLLRNTRNKA